jgi:hypothetical protein
MRIHFNTDPINPYKKCVHGSMTISSNLAQSNIYINFNMSCLERA